MGVVAVTRSSATPRAATRCRPGRSPRVPAQRCRLDAREPRPGNSGSSPCTSLRSPIGAPLGSRSRKSAIDVNGRCARLSTNAASAPGSMFAIEAASNSAGAVLTLSGVPRAAPSRTGPAPQASRRSSRARRPAPATRIAGMFGARPGCGVRSYHASSAPPGSLHAVRIDPVDDRREHRGATCEHLEQARETQALERRMRAAREVVDVQQALRIDDASLDGPFSTGVAGSGSAHGSPR